MTCYKILRYALARQVQMKEEETEAQFDGEKKLTTKNSPHPLSSQTPLELTVTVAAAPTQSGAVEKRPARDVQIPSTQASATKAHAKPPDNAPGWVRGEWMQMQAHVSTGLITRGADRSGPGRCAFNPQR